MRLVVDTGALLALERNERPMWRRFKAAQLAETVAVTHGGVVAQAWHGRGPRQALLAKALFGVEVGPSPWQPPRAVTLRSYASDPWPDSQVVRLYT